MDILVRRSDFDAVKIALEAVGFTHHELMGVDCFVDGPDGSPRNAVHLRDFISIGLVDATWIPNLLPEHAERLQQLLDDPDG